MKKKHIGVMLLATLISLIILLGVATLILNYKIQRDRERYGYIAQNECDKVVTIVDCVMARISTLKAFVQEHNGDSGFFDNVAGSVYESVFEETGVSLKNVALAPDGVVTHVYPLEGNEALVGFNFLDESRAGNAEAKEAYEEGKTILTNPFELIQGGRGFAGRSPVLVKQGDSERLWGLVTVTMDFDNFITMLKLRNLADMGLNYELSFFDDEGNRQVMDSYGVLDRNPVRCEFAVRNLSWELAVSPREGWIPWELVIITVAVILTISLLIGILMNMLLSLRDSNETLLLLSTMDELTGCLNRRAYEEELARLSEETQDERLICASADVNGLKTANDSLGHVVGDGLLTAAAACLKNTFSTYGNVYRTGGDEFEILFRADDKQYDRIQKELRKEIHSKEESLEVPLSISIGYASRKDFPEKSIPELLKIADDRMYVNKRAYYEANGRDRRKG